MKERSKRSRRLLGLAVSATGFALILAGAVGAGEDSGAIDVSSLKIADPDSATAELPQAAKTGKVNVVVRLEGAPLAVANGANWKQRGGKLTPGQQRDYVRRLGQKQDALMQRIAPLGGRELARVTKALNAVVVAIDASKVDELARLPNVASVRGIGDYELDLSETVPHIGAAAVQAAGFDGSGITVAVIDSGIDYTHASMGGTGTAAAYTAAYGTRTSDPKNRKLDKQFPTAKVVGGFDFVGEEWPSGPLKPDPDPIDCGDAVIAPPCAGGHGTHVSDIIAGIGTSEGVGTAPGADLLAVKACSAVSTSCSGVALLNAMDFSLDPNGDGDVSDAADVINMSLGSDYGQIEDELGFASTNAVNAGVVVVAAAGNAADKPYIVSSPSTTPEAISVAQTQVPSAKLFLIDPSAPSFASAGGSHQPWSAPPTLVTGTLEYNAGSLAKKRGCNTDGSNPYAAGEHTGDVLLVDRGICNVSLKVNNAAAAGAVAAVIGNNALQAPGDLPPDFAFGGGALADDIAGYTITLRDANKLKGLPETTAVNSNPVSPNALNAPATIDPATAASLVFHMVSISARGPSVSLNAIKPDIGAPGASNSAEAGTGTGNTAFGGTSGATPMVSGSAALLLEKEPSRTPFEIKSVLMNTGETDIGLNPVGLPGVLAPITRIGGGEVQVDEAVGSMTAAWDDAANTGSLSYGFHTLTDLTTVARTVRVRNYGGSPTTYSISSAFRYSNDAASGAVSVSHPPSITVPADSSSTFDVTLQIDPSKLPFWDLSGGSRGGDGFRLQGVEFDGYVNIAGGGDNVHLAFQVLPRRSAAVTPDVTAIDLMGPGPDKVDLENGSGVQDGVVEVFSLLGTSGQIPASELPNPGDNFAVIDLKSVGARLLDPSPAAGNELLQFGINTFGTRAHPNYPAEFDVQIDADRDGDDDYLVFTAENGGFGATGQNVVFVWNLDLAFTAPGAVRGFFFTDADLNTANAILTVPIAGSSGALAFPSEPLTPTTKFDFDVLAFDNYFTGASTDSVVNMTFTPATPRFEADAVTLTVPAGDKEMLKVSAVPGGDAASPSQTGLQLLYRLAKQPQEADTITVTP